MSDTEYIPDGYTAVTPYLVAEDAPGLIDFLANAFGAVERVRIPGPDGGIRHAEVVIGGDVIMLCSVAPPEFKLTNAHINLYVEDVDSTYAGAMGAGATSVQEPANQIYGDRGACITDPAGNTWSLSSPVEDITEEEVRSRIEAAGDA